MKKILFFFGFILLTISNQSRAAAVPTPLIGLICGYGSTHLTIELTKKYKSYFSNDTVYPLVAIGACANIAIQGAIGTIFCPQDLKNFTQFCVTGSLFKLGYLGYEEYKSYMISYASLLYPNPQSTTDTISGC